MDPCGLISNKDDDDDTISSVDVVVSFVINAAAYITGSVVIGVEKVTASVADKTSAWDFENLTFSFNCTISDFSDSTTAWQLHVLHDDWEIHVIRC